MTGASALLPQVADVEREMRAAAAARRLNPKRYNGKTRTANPFLLVREFSPAELRKVAQLLQPIADRVTPKVWTTPSRLVLTNATVDTVRLSALMGAAYVELAREDNGHGLQVTYGPADGDGWVPDVEPADPLTADLIAVDGLAVAAKQMLDRKDLPAALWYIARGRMLASDHLPYGQSWDDMAAAAVVHAAANGFGQDSNPVGSPVDNPVEPPPELSAYTPSSQDDLAPSGQVARIRANIAALQVLRRVQTEDRPASAAEQQILARWSGWGAVPGVFDPHRDDHAAYQWARAELAQLLSEEEYTAARRTVLNAHYTDAAVVQAVWKAVAELGFTGGDVLEPGCGSGNFIGFAPPSARMVGVELDPTTAAISAALYPHARILAESFADSRLAQAGFDLVVGNVPFADVVLSDPLHNPGRHSIHNHFLIKSLHLLKPGGMMAVLTSRYTMDAVNPAARREIAAMADLVGAVRLPSGAMARAAGTDAVIDVLLLRRRETGRAPLDAAGWERTRRFESDGQSARVNSYFLDHPEHVLGRLHLGRGLYGSEEVRVDGDKDCAPALAATLQRITASAAARDLTHRPQADSEQDEPIAVTAVLDRMPEGYLAALPDGTFTQVVDGQPIPYAPPQTQAAELRALLHLRDLAMRLLTTEGRHREDNAEISGLRKRLTVAYDGYWHTYGPINRYTLSESKGDTDGEPTTRRTFPGQGGFRGDPWSALVYALEDFDEATQVARKTAIFSKRIIGPRHPRLGADTPEDAISICRDLYGTLSLERIAWLLGVEEDEARRRLGTLVFDDPATGQMVSAAEYLSGNVRAKLAEAEKAADKDERYLTNVWALAKVVPADLTSQEIRVRLGAVWINAATVQTFLREILADPTVVVEHDRGSLWDVRSRRTDTVLATSTWGTDRVNAIDLADALLNQKSLQVYDTNRITGKRTPNSEATLAVQSKAAELNDKFVSWLWSDPERATWHLRHYNDLFNSLVLRSYDGIELSLPGMALTFKPHPHQYAAVARIVSEASVGLFHEVGAGKTAEMVMGSQELKRLGLVRKPMIIVPNHMLEQFTREYLQLYPNANLLSASSADLGGKKNERVNKRRRFLARATTGDWDAIIMTHKSFESIAMSVQAQRTFLKEKVKKLEERLENANLRGEKMLVKALEKQIARTEERIKGKLAGRKDDGLTFEALGVDYLFVDEAHLFKNLARSSKIPGMTVSPGSNRATDLEMKLHWLRQQVDEDAAPRKRVCTLATATPISNSIGEIHTMLMYLAPELLAAYDIDEFDAFAATFGETVEAIEVKPEGGGLRVNSRFARFYNLPELLRILHQVSDVKTAEDLAGIVTTPGLVAREDGQRLPQVRVVEQSDPQAGYLQTLVWRADQVRAGKVEPTEDNLLKITHNGRSAALDLRLVPPTRDEILAVLDEVDFGGQRRRAELMARAIHEQWTLTPPDRQNPDTIGWPHSVYDGEQEIWQGPLRDGVTHALHLLLEETPYDLPTVDQIAEVLHRHGMFSQTRLRLATANTIVELWSQHRPDTLRPQRILWPTHVFASSEWLWNGWLPAPTQQALLEAYATHPDPPTAGDYATILDTYDGLGDADVRAALAGQLANHWMAHPIGTGQPLTWPQRTADGAPWPQLNLAVKDKLVEIYQRAQHDVPADEFAAQAPVLLAEAMRTYDELGDEAVRIAVAADLAKVWAKQPPPHTEDIHAAVWPDAIPAPPQLLWEGEFTDELKAAILAIRPIDPSASTKITVAAGEIAERYHRHVGDVYLDERTQEPHPRTGALQIVFLDLGTPADGWNAYHELREQLVERGVPAAKVRFVHEAKNDSEKAILFASARDGRTAVLVGSTDKMGVGTNVQHRAIALHHLDCPWRPADLQQREGRIIRQRNQNAEVEVLRYVTEGSFDGFMWGTVARKAEGIAQLLRGRLDVREIEDIGDAALSYNEVKALATGNPLLLEHAQVQATVTKLERLERSHSDERRRLDWQIKQHTRDIDSMDQVIATFDTAIAARVDVTGDKFTMAVDGQVTTKRPQAQAMLAAAVAAAFNPGRHAKHEIATIAGFTVTAESIYLPEQERRLVVVDMPQIPNAAFRLGRSDIEDSDLVSRLENRLRGLEHERAKVQRSIDRLNADIAVAHAQREMAFRHADTLAEARIKLDELTSKLREQNPATVADTVVATDDPAEPVTEPSTPPRDPFVPAPPPVLARPVPTVYNLDNGWNGDVDAALQVAVAVTSLRGFTSKREAEQAQLRHGADLETTARLVERALTSTHDDTAAWRAEVQQALTPQVAYRAALIRQWAAGQPAGADGFLRSLRDIARLDTMSSRQLPTLVAAPHSYAKHEQTEAAALTRAVSTWQGKVNATITVTDATVLAVVSATTRTAATSSVTLVDGYGNLLTWKDALHTEATPGQTGTLSGVVSAHKVSGATKETIVQRATWHPTSPATPPQPQTSPTAPEQAVGADHGLQLALPNWQVRHAGDLTPEQAPIGQLLAELAAEPRVRAWATANSFDRFEMVIAERISQFIAEAHDRHPEVALAYFARGTSQTDFNTEAAAVLYHAIRAGHPTATTTATATATATVTAAAAEPHEQVATSHSVDDLNQRVHAATEVLYALAVQRANSGASWDPRLPDPDELRRLAGSTDTMVVSSDRKLFASTEHHRGTYAIHEATTGLRITPVGGDLPDATAAEHALEELVSSGVDFTSGAEHLYDNDDPTIGQQRARVVAAAHQQPAVGGTQSTVDDTIGQAHEPPQALRPEHPDRTPEAVPELRQLLLRHAIEHEAARWAATPGVGPSGAARYIWETLHNHDGAPRLTGTEHEYEWIHSYLRDHPEVFDLPPTTSTLAERRRELSAEAEQRALHAYRAGDFDTALHAVDEAEALRPNPGNYFAKARAAVQSGTEDKGAAQPPAPPPTAAQPLQPQQQQRGTEDVIASTGHAGLPPIVDEPNPAPAIAPLPEAEKRDLQQALLRRADALAQEQARGVTPLRNVPNPAELRSLAEQRLLPSADGRFFAIHDRDAGGWTVHEATTGMRLTRPAQTLADQRAAQRALDVLAATTLDFTVAAEHAARPPHEVDDPALQRQLHDAVTAAHAPALDETPRRIVAAHPHPVAAGLIAARRGQHPSVARTRETGEQFDFPRGEVIHDVA